MCERDVAAAAGEEPAHVLRVGEHEDGEAAAAARRGSRVRPSAT